MDGTHETDAAASAIGPRGGSTHEEGNRAEERSSEVEMSITRLCKRLSQGSLLTKERLSPRQQMGCPVSWMTNRADMTMTMTHSEKSVHQPLEAWPYRRERRGHDPAKKVCYN